MNLFYSSKANVYNYPSHTLAHALSFSYRRSYSSTSVAITASVCSSRGLCFYRSETMRLCFLFSLCCLLLHPGCTAMLGWLNDILWVMMLCSSLYTNHGYYDNDISLHYSFLARGSHQMLDACAAAQMQKRKMLTKPKSLLNVRLSRWIKKKKAGDNKQILGTIYHFLNLALKPCRD